MPRAFFHSDQILLADALLTWQPGAGPPLVIGLGRLLNVFIRDPFVALVTLSVIASVAGALLFGVAVERVIGNAWVGAAAVGVAFLSPAMLVFGPLPQGTSVALACIAASCLFLAERRWLALAVAVAAAIAAQPLGALQWEADVAVRFVAHPWGSKFLSLPVLLAAAVGIFRLGAPRFAVFGAVAAAGCLLFAPRTNGVLAATSVMPLVALFAIAAVARWPAVAVALSAAFAAASIIYTRPALEERRRPLAPAAVALHSVADDAVVVASPDLVPFGSVAPGTEVVTPERLDAIPAGRKVRLLVHGRSAGAGARTFGEPAVDVCRKLEGERFHLVSIVEPARFAGRRGVYAMESSPERGEWRWLAREAVIELPDAAPVQMRFRLPDDAPLESNRLTVDQATVEIARGGVAEVTVAPTSRVVIRAERTFTPRDGRELSVQLVSLALR